MAPANPKRTIRTAARRETALSTLTLFASMGTLVCCALPIALVALAGGASVVALLDSAPFLVPLTRNKEFVFVGAALLIGGSAWLLWRPGRSCPTDPALAAACRRAERWNRRLVLLSAAIWGVGFFAAFLALPLRKALGL